MLLALLLLTSCAGTQTTVDESSTAVEAKRRNESTTAALYTLENSNTSEEALTIQAAYLDGVATNPDTIGWIKCDALGINEPVVAGVDNREYLRTNFNGEPDPHGAVFLDSRCNLEFAPLLKMLHGHNMKDNTMFAAVPSLLKLESTSKAPKVLFYTQAGGLGTFKVISVFSVSSKEEALPLDVMYSVEDLQLVKEQLIDKSFIRVDSTTETDGVDLLLLNTCWYGESGTERNLHCIVVLVRE